MGPVMEEWRAFVRDLERVLDRIARQQEQLARQHAEWERAFQQRWEAWEERFQRQREEWEERLQRQREEWEKQREQDRKEWEERLRRQREEWEKELQEERKQWEARLERQREEWEKRLEQQRQEWEKRLEKQREEWEKQREQARKEWEERQRREEEEHQRKMRRIEERIRKMEERYGLQWGRLIEALMQGGIEQAFTRWGIAPIRFAEERRKVFDEQRRILAEYDIILTNEIMAVVVEVKAKMEVADVKRFIGKLWAFPKLIPFYRTYRVYGAVAALEYGTGVEAFAQKRGLFVLKLHGDIVQVVNPPDFRPRNYNALIENQTSQEVHE